MTLTQASRFSHRVDGGGRRHLWTDARAIARDLGAFVSSFERPPADVVDRWLRRFDEKYARDPSYFLKA